ncbi:MAG: DUF896 domain-containing protein [Ruminococcus sp.]|nr:DUF896 domain-containing protein [Ruminococcus sp.]
MESWKLERLSELTAISRTREFTESEKKERESLRMEYRMAVLGSLKADLEQVTIKEQDGTLHKAVDGQSEDEKTSEEVLNDGGRI